MGIIKHYCIEGLGNVRVMYYKTEQYDTIQN